MPELSENVKKLIEKKYDPSGALYREITERADEIITTVQDTANTLNDEIRGNFERLGGIIDSKNNDDIVAGISALKEYLENMEIEIEL